MPHQRDNHWMVTYTGKQFWPLDPRPEDICIEDIAHSLSNICRFGGHSTSFYSVAQHSVLVSMACLDSMYGLLHDAPEAYLGDVIRPLKEHPQFKDFYRDAENALMACIILKFNLKMAPPQSLKWADDSVLMTEKRDLVAPHDYIWTNVHVATSVEPLDYHIEPMAAPEAKVYFLERYNELCQVQRKRLN